MKQYTNTGTARQWRIEYPGAFYHFLARDNAGQDVLLCDKDKRLFLDILEEFSGLFQIEIHAYVLMNNLNHLLIRPWERNLSKSLQRLGASYTRKFNLSNKRIGGELPHKNYRMMVQQYSEEMKKIWENVKRSLILGSDNFAEKIKESFSTRKGKNEIS